MSVIVAARDTESYLISGLDEFTTYELFINASTRIGSGPAAELTVTTNPSRKRLFMHTQMYNNNVTVSNFTDPHAPPQNVEVVVTGNRTVTVRWLPPPSEQQNGLIVYYLLVITDRRLGSNTEINSTTTSFMATGLKVYNNYSCIVAAATTVGLGPYSLPVSFTTLQGGKLPFALDPALLFHDQ